MSEADLRAREIRRFSRFYTRKIGVLAADLLDTPFSLAEARLLYELAQTEPATAAALRDVTGLDQDISAAFWQVLSGRAWSPGGWRRMMGVCVCCNSPPRGAPHSRGWIAVPRTLP